MDIKKQKIIHIALFSLTLLLTSYKPSFAQTVDPNNPGGAPTPQALLEAGITQVRVVLKNDAATPTYVKSLQDAGIKVVGIINWEYGSNGAWPQNGAGSQQTSSYINNFVNNVIPAAYQQYGGLHAYQVWNEPDDKNPAYSNSVKVMSAENYGTLLGLAHGALHQLSSNQQQVISAGLVSGDPAYLAALLSAGGTADGYSLHPYVVRPDRENAIQEVIDAINSMANATGRPIWITEFGWETSDQVAQAAWLLQVYQLQQNMTNINSVMWYAFSDAQNPGFGLVDATGTPKLAFIALMQHLAGHPISDEQIQLLLANNFAKCTTVSGQFIGYAVNEAQCALYRPCLDDGGNVIGYAFGVNLCKFQDDVRAMCGGMVDLEPITYMPEVVGHNISKPFALSAAFSQDLDSTNEDLLVDILKTDLVLTASWDHPNLAQPYQQIFGSIDPSSEHFISNRMSPEKLNIPLFTMTPKVKNGTIKASYGVSSQPDIEYEYGRTPEDALDYAKRIYKTAITQDKEEFGLKAEIPTMSFNACIQRIGCSAEIEGDKACIREDSKGVFPIYCTAADPADKCVSAGRLFSFQGEIIYEEPPEMQGLSRAYQNFLYDKLVRVDSASQPYAGKAKYEKLMVDSSLPDPKVNSTMNYVNANEENKTLADSDNGIPFRNPDPQTRSSSLFTSITKPTEANAQTIDESLNNGSYQTTTPQSCQNMTALVENKGTFYAVKAWDTQPLSCPYQFDYALDVTYYVNGTAVGGCSHDLIPRSTMPKWGENNPNTNNGAWGLSISDIGASGDAANRPGGNCSVPVVPTAGEVLTVDIKIVGNAPDGVAGCGGKTAFCTTGNLKVDTNRPEAIDCRVCPSWAPPAMCAKIVSPEIITQSECTDGDCKAQSVLMESDSPMSLGESIVIPTVNLLSAFGQWLTTSLGITSTACEFKTEAEYEILPNGERVPTGDDENVGLDCRFNAQQYSVYTYPSRPFVGDFGQRSKNMQVNDIISNINGYTNKYFDPENAKAPVSLTMSIGDREALDGNGNAAFESDEILSSKSGFGTNSTAELDALDNYLYIGFTDDSGADRTMYLDYTLFNQPQVSGYCLTQRFLTPILSETQKIPKSVANSGLCNRLDFMPGNTAYNQNMLMAKLAEEGNRSLAQGANYLSANVEEELEVAGGRLIMDTDKVVSDINTNVALLDQVPLEQKMIAASKATGEIAYRELSNEERDRLREEFISDLETILNKYKVKSPDLNALPEGARAEMEAIKMKFEKKLIVYNR